MEQYQGYIIEKTNFNDWTVKHDFKYFSVSEYIPTFRTKKAAKQFIDRNRILEEKLDNEETIMGDIRTIPFKFQDTTIHFEAISQKGKDLFSKMFGEGAVSAELPKSKGIDFERYVIQKGLTLI